MIVLIDLKNTMSLTTVAGDMPKPGFLPRHSQQEIMGHVMSTSGLREGTPHILCKRVIPLEH